MAGYKIMIIIKNIAFIAQKSFIGMYTKGLHERFVLHLSICIIKHRLATKKKPQLTLI